MKSPILFTTLLLCFAAMQAQTKVFTEYWSNGTKATEGTLNQDNIRTGEWTWFHENGNKQTEGSYDDKGNKIGIWTSYYPDGKVQKTEVFSGSGRHSSQTANCNTLIPLQTVKDKEGLKNTTQTDKKRPKPSTKTTNWTDKPSGGMKMVSKTWRES